MASNKPRFKEKAIENQIKDYLNLCGVYWFKVHGSNFMVPGIPDLICCHQGRFIGIEVKASTGGVQSEQQRIHERNIKRAGGIYILANSLDSIREVIR